MKVGDVVNCMGTREKMTVAKVEGDDAWCQWFDREDELNERSFALANLHLVPQPETIQ